MGHIRTGALVIGAVLCLGAFILASAWWTNRLVDSEGTIVGLASWSFAIGLLILVAATFVPHRKPRDG